MAFITDSFPSGIVHPKFTNPEPLLKTPSHPKMKNLHLLTFLLLTFLLLTFFSLTAADEIKSNDFASLQLAEPWKPSPGSSLNNVVFQGTNGNRFLIFAAWPLTEIKAANPRAAVEKLDALYIQAAQDESKNKAKIVNFGITEENGQILSGHCGLVPSRGLVFFRRLIASDKTIISLYVEYTGFSQAPDVKKLTEEFFTLAQGAKIKP